MNELKEWWAQASARDQLALVFGGGFLAIYILFVAVLQPLKEMRDKEYAKNRSLRGSLETVRELAAQVSVQKSSGGSKESASSLERIVQQSVANNGLQVASMNASGKNGLRMRFEESVFENVLKWLHEMEVSHRLQIKDISVAAGSTPGRVTVNLRLHKS